MVVMEEPRSNLVDKAWILSRLKSGEVVELSLRDYFKRVYEIDRIQTDNPLTDTAIFGVVLVIFARAAFLADSIDTSGGPAQWIRQMREPDPNNLAAVLGYLEIFKDRFWLVGGERPFSLLVAWFWIRRVSTSRFVLRRL